MNFTFKNSLVLLALTLALLRAPALRAQSLTFNVDINTAGLSADSGNAPFYLDFQMLYGNSSLASNTATLSNFQFTGGSVTGSTTVLGSATGDLSSSVVLTASSTHTDSELYQAFTSGVTDIKFQATITETGPDVGFPTEFAASIMDNSLGSPAPLFTTAPDTESLVTLNLSSSNTADDVGYYSAVSSADSGTAISGVSAIPEPSTTAAILGGVAALLALGARRLGLLRTV